MGEESDNGDSGTDTDDSNEPRFEGQTIMNADGEDATSGKEDTSE